MKKTLAAVLAAAMALSTASVVFAADSQDVDISGDMATATDKKDSTKKDGVKMGDTSKFVIGDISGINGRKVDPDGAGLIAQKDVADLIDRGILRATVTVTSGKSNLASSPVVKVVGEEAQLQFKNNHSYATSSSKVSMKIRLTVSKDLYFNDEHRYGTAKKNSQGTEIYNDDDLFLKKGDTLNGPEITYEAEYGTIDYGKDMTITLQEVKDNVVRAKGEELFTNAGSDDKVTIYFDNYAAFETKISPSQKDVNLYYSVDEVSDVVDAYPDVDFEFLTFKGSKSVTSFVNSGTMTFNAIGGKNTQVYKLETAGGGDDGDTLVPLDGTYDSSYGTITVKNIKRLSGTFVVASEILEVEDDEDNEPVDSAPVVEEPSSSEAPSTSNERNPSTGAC